MNSAETVGIETESIPQSRLHVAIIMDGNGRWAISRAHDRSDGHRAGADNVRRIVEAAPSLGVRSLTLYAFSRDNWSRPGPEVANLMTLLREFLDTERERCVRDSVRIDVIGSRQRLGYALRRSIAAAESATACGTRLDLRIAIDYSSRKAILAAAGRAASSCGRAMGGEPHGARTLRAARLLSGARLPPSLPADNLANDLADSRDAEIIPNVDLLIRTGGEQRLSDFLLWECAYAELYFTRILWPDFTPRDLKRAIEDFRRRDRRFGSVTAVATDKDKDYWLR